MLFIEKTEYTADLSKMTYDFNKIISDVGWLEEKMEKNGKTYHAGQIGLTHRVDAEYPWYDAGGSLYSILKGGQFTDKEISFTEWNPVGEYTKEIIENLKESLGINFGRMRYMRLMPKKGLTVHKDFDVRYHYVLKTNEHSYFGLSEPTTDTIGTVEAKCYHLPADGYFYRVDTRRSHFVYNGGWEPRIHLVLADARHEK